MKMRSSRSRLLGELRETKTWNPRLFAELSARALQNNYQAIQDQVPDQAILPMLKANAYGHDAVWAAGILDGLPGLYGFGVATLEEGSELRRELGPRGRRTRILVFSGCTPWSDEKGHFCESHGLTPVIASDDDWKSFLKQGWPARLPYEIKFNTGMNRLGLSVTMARQVVNGLRNHPAEWHPEGILTHLAKAESPDDPLSLLQRERFEAIRRELSAAFPAALYHLGNSSTIWHAKKWRLSGFTDLVRPGLSLYGIPPWPGAPARGLQAVMTVRANVMAIHELKPGESLGYGATYTVSKKETSSVRVAILSAGYADGVHRALSNRGHAWISGIASRFIGRVSMDICAIRCTSETRVGDLAEIIGPEVDPWAQATAAETIPYELLTSISGRVQRKYG